MTGDQITAASSAGAWEAQQCIADLLVSLEETDIKQKHRQEIAMLAFRAFDGLQHRIAQSLSVEESLRLLGEENRERA